MKISHLVTVGCSWTYCQGLENPKIQGWPALLAKKLNVPVVNLALPGAGNDAIHRRTYEYFFEDVKNNNNPFYIVAWSQMWRREAWCSAYYNPNVPNSYSIIAMPDKTPTNPYEEALLDNWSEEDFLRKTNLYRLSLNSLFTAHNIDYVESFFTGNYTESAQIVEKKFSNASHFLKNKTMMCEPFYKIVEKYPKLPCGHEGYESMPVLADYIYNYILSNYGNITVVEKPFLSLAGFNNKDNTFKSSWE